jgi:hypothetical protein
MVYKKFQKVTAIIFALMLLTCLTSFAPKISLAGPPTNGLSSSYGWMCEQCINGDSWWCAGCFGLTHQQYDALRY